VIRRIREFLTKDVHEMAVFNINEVVEEAIAFANAELLGSKIVLRVDLARELPAIRGNRIQLQQVVLNLLMNGRDAIVAAASGTRKLLVKSQRSDDGGVVVAVQDSGIGLKREDADRIFDAFFTTKATGIGMGLSISRSIIETHAGRIWAEPNAGPGLTVQFSLPADDRR
jgi:signal transduction histidine kinase